MSRNVQNVQFTRLESIRWPQFTHMKDAGYTDIDIAVSWHLKSAKQVQRLKKKAKQNGAYKKWADDKLSWIGEEFPELHAIVKKKNINLAYVVMARLYGKGIPTQIEAKTEIEHRKILEIDDLSSEEREFAKSIAGKYIKTRNQKRSSTIH